MVLVTAVGTCIGCQTVVQVVVIPCRTPFGVVVPILFSVPKHVVVHAGVTVLKLAGSLCITLEQRALVDGKTIRTEIHLSHLAGDVADIGQHGMSDIQGHLIRIAMALSKDVLGIGTLLQTCRVALSCILQDEHIAVALIDIVDTGVHQSCVVEQRIVLIVHHLLGSILGNGQQF